MDLEHFNAFMQSYADYIKSSIEEKRKTLEHFFTRWSVAMCGENVPKAISLLDKIFSNKGLQKEKDWVVIELDGKNESAPENVYDLLYTHNDKIIVLHGFKDLLKGENRYLFWKRLFEYYDVIHDYPVMHCQNNSNKYYNVDTLNNRERCYKEVNEQMLPNKFQFTGLVILLSDNHKFGEMLKEVDDNYQISIRDRCWRFEIGEEL